MKSLANKTILVALAMALWGTSSSMAAGGVMSTVPVRQAEDKEMKSTTTATSILPLYALTALDEEILAAQEMTDQELKAVEGGMSNSESISQLSGALFFNLMWYDYLDGFSRGYCGC
jgi:bacteriocin-like protein